LRQLSTPFQNPVLVEMTWLKIPIVPIKQLDLAALLGGNYIDAGAFQSSAVVLPTLWFDDMKARSPHSNPCSMKGSIIRYSSSAL
jgi:hypothetical protein